MKLKCTINTLSGIIDEPMSDLVKQYLHFSDDYELNIKIGHEYFVYGIAFRENYPFFYILEYEGDEYPVPLPACFFKIMDDRLSKHWHLTFDCSRNSRTNKRQAFSYLLADEWAKDPMFYERLTDSEEPYLSKFKEIRKLIETEFNDQNS